jgi:hypothetical protein
MTERIINGCTYVSQPAVNGLCTGCEFCAEITSGLHACINMWPDKLPCISKGNKDCIWRETTVKLKQFEEVDND